MNNERLPRNQPDLKTSWESNGRQKREWAFFASGNRHILFNHKRRMFFFNLLLKNCAVLRMLRFWFVSEVLWRFICQGISGFCWKGQRGQVKNSFVKKVTEVAHEMRNGTQNASHEFEKFQILREFNRLDYSLGQLSFIWFYSGSFRRVFHITWGFFC